MPKAIARTITSIIVLSIISLVILLNYQNYLATKKYYPNMTYWDHLLIGDKFVITPNGDGK
jgi:hypothetical protein